MMELLQEFIPKLEQLGFAGYWLLMFVTFAETFVLLGIFIPGTAVLVIMGGLASYEYYDYTILAVFALIGAITGNIVSFELGKMGKLHEEKFPKIVKNTVAGAKNFFNQHKAKSIFLARFIGPIRPVLPFVAGISEMKRGQFYLYTVLSALLWCPSYLALGYAFGYAWKRALTWSSVAVTVLVAVVILAFASAWMIRWYRRRFA